LLYGGIYNIKIGLPRCVTTSMAWMDGRLRLAGTGGKWLAAGRNRRLGRQRRERGLRGARVQAKLGRWTGGQTGKPTVQIEPKSRVARLC